MARKFLGFNQTIQGEHTDDELAAARAVGYINTANRSLPDVMDERKADLPAGWELTWSDATHSAQPEPPSIPAAENEPILMGFIRVHSGDPSYPVWLYKRNF